MRILIAGSPQSPHKGSLILGNPVLLGHEVWAKDFVPLLHDMGHIGLYGVIWRYIVLYRVIWGYMGLYRDIWGYLGLYRVIWVFIEFCGII